MQYVYLYSKLYTTAHELRPEILFPHKFVSQPYLTTTRIASQRKNIIFLSISYDLELSIPYYEFRKVKNIDFYRFYALKNK
jgi:hypothetical protein